MRPPTSLWVIQHVQGSGAASPASDVLYSFLNFVFWDIRPRRTVSGLLVRGGGLATVSRLLFALGSPQPKVLMAIPAGGDGGSITEATSSSRLSSWHPQESNRRHWRENCVFFSIVASYVCLSAVNYVAYIHAQTNGRLVP